MKKRIGTKLYDTEKAKKVITYDTCNAGIGKTDFRYYEETLYVKRTGEFFLYGEGNGLSEYRASYIDGWGFGYKIIPLTLDGAKKWFKCMIEKVDNAGWDTEEEKRKYKELFG